MYGVLLQDWVTVRLNSTVTTVTQSEPMWLDVEDYRDVVFTADVQVVSKGGGTNVNLAYETSPSKDDDLFSAMSTVTLTPGRLFITKILESQNPSVPLSKWLRWRLSVTGSPSSEWGATFRIFCSLNASRVM